MVKNRKSSFIKKVRSSLGKTGYNFIEEMNNLKKIKNIASFRKALDIKLANPTFKLNLHNNQEIYREKFRKSNSVFPKSEFLKELYIAAVKINKNASLINEFCKIKGEFERDFLLGKIDEAHVRLEEAREFTGLSYWYLESKLSVLAWEADNSKLSAFYKSIHSLELEPVEIRDFNLLFDKAIESIPSDRIDFSLDSLIDGVSLDCADYSTVDFLFRFNPLRETDYESVLRYFGPCNIVDIFLSTSRVIYCKYANDKLDDEALNIIRMIVGIEDEKWSNFNLTINDKVNISKKEAVFLKVCDEYIKGEYDKVVSLCEQVLNDWPDFASVYEFYINSLYNTNKKSSFSSSTLLGQIFEAVIQYISSRGHLDVNVINKKIYQNQSIDSFQIINLIKSKNNILTQNNSAKVIYRFLDVGCTTVNPFHRSNYDDGSLCYHLNSISDLSKVNNEIPSYRILKRKADEKFELAAYREAADGYKGIQGYPKHFEDELIIKEIFCLLKSGDIELAVKKLCGNYFNKNINMARFPCTEFLFEIENYPYELPINIQLIIVIYILVEVINADKHIVSMYFDDFMDELEIEFPSDILPNSQEERFLLEFVLSVDVLEGVHICRKIYDGSSHLMFDRVLILSSLLDIETCENKKELFKNEISFLGHKYAKNFSLKDLSPGKIEVDSAALTAKAVDRNKDSYLKITHALKNELQLPELDEFGNFLGDEVISLRESFTYAYQLLLDIRDLYTLDEYFGLDYSLNTDIRHNGIVPVIRSVFEAHGLLSSKVNGIYKDNVEFEKRYQRVLKVHFYKAMQEELKDFSSEIDTRINNLKTRVIKIITNEKDDQERIFKFIITEFDVNKLLTLISAGSSYVETIEYCFQHLEQLTERSMEVGRELLLEGLEREFTKKLTKLHQSLTKIGRGNVDFLARIALTKNDLRNTLQEVSEWLAFSNKTGDDFSIDFPLYEAKLFVEKIFPKVKINLDISNLFIGEQYDGRVLNSFIKVFIMLIENATKRRFHEDYIDIIVKVYNKDEKSYIEVHNLTKNIDLKIIEDINSQINGAQITLKANREKGSGLYKVKKIFDIDLKVENEISISAEDNNFFVKIIYSNSSFIR